MRNLFCIIIVIIYSVTLSAQERITLLFVGDLMQHEAQIKAAKTNEGYDYSDCTINVNVTKPPEYFKVINNNAGLVFKIPNTSVRGYSDGGWYRDPSEPDTFGGFFGNTKFIYDVTDSGENVYLHGSNHPNQTATSSFKFYA